MVMINGINKEMKAMFWADEMYFDVTGNIFNAHDFITELCLYSKTNHDVHVYLICNISEKLLDIIPLKNRITWTKSFFLLQYENVGMCLRSKMY